MNLLNIRKLQQIKDSNIFNMKLIFETCDIKYQKAMAQLISGTELTVTDAQILTEFFEKKVINFLNELT